MNGKKMTTRKGFLKQAGLAVVGALALTRTGSAESKSEPSHVNATQALRVISRIRPARGIVERSSV